MSDHDTQNLEAGGVAPAQTGLPGRTLDPTALLARLWKQNLPIVRDRVTCLERAAQACADGQFTEALREEAINVAHKLAGSLGMFGYPRGTEIAREVEQMLEDEPSPDPGRFQRLAAELHATLPL